MERAGEYFLDFESQINESSVIGCNEKKSMSLINHVPDFNFPTEPLTETNKRS